jgi:DNA modification methylase
MITLFNGDCLEVLKTLEDNSIDSIVTDAPYGLAFMGKKWDYDVPSQEIWKECLRVLKPGGHLLSFGGTRTYHRMVVAIEDAGFEIRDQIMWIYGSGFPKSMDISKAIDKQAGAIRGKEKCGTLGSSSSFADDKWTQENAGMRIVDVAITDSAKQWQGWGTALKPANEPICLARKPISEKTVATNVLKHGTGAINIDGCRVGSDGGTAKGSFPNEKSNGIYGNGLNGACDIVDLGKGRWPANVIFDEEAGRVLDEQSGISKSISSKRGNGIGDGYHGSDKEFDTIRGHSDSGGASRFFYCAKASKSERNAGLEELPLKESGIKNDSGRGFSESDPHKKIFNQNFHPTVKPIKLMEYLCKLITPPGGVVLDPFMGSGTTGKAAINLGFKFVGIEREKEYFEIAQKRING